MATKEKILPPIKETASDYSAIERGIIEVFERELYAPLLRILGVTRIMNAKPSHKNPLVEAIEKRSVTFSNGEFKGKFSAAVSKILKEYGATWNGKTKSFEISISSLPIEIQNSISVSLARFQDRLKAIDDAFRKILPEEIAERVKLSEKFKVEAWKVDKSISKTLKGIAVPPQLTPNRLQFIADEWQNNMRLSIKGFAEKEIKQLRARVLEHSTKGGRYDELVKEITRSYRITKRRARFIARQETSLLAAKMKAVRYAEAGVTEYVWGCVAGSKEHPVRPSHKALEGKRFRWDEPPITTPPGQAARRNNPGEDYNCRCFAKPVVRLLEGDGITKAPKKAAKPDSENKWWEKQV